MFFTKLKNLLSNQETIEGISGIADLKEKVNKIDPIFFAPEDFLSEAEQQEDIFNEIANSLDMDHNLLRAFVKVEAGGRNCDENGRVIIRWESHIFKKYTGINIKVHGGRSIQDNEWEAYKRAALKLQGGKYGSQAIMSTSWGIGQIMGFHYKRLGFGSPRALSKYISESKENALKTIGLFISTSKSLLKACQTFDYHNIARYYNGKSYKKYAVGGKDYAMKIQEEYESLTKV